MDSVAYGQGVREKDSPIMLMQKRRPLTFGENPRAAVIALAYG
jgi:hypothetical protein